jgi:hypothetical protein
MGLPSTTYSEIIDRTSVQERMVRELETKGWIIVTEPENIFNGSMLMEAPDSHSHYIRPDGSVE